MCVCVCVCVCNKAFFQHGIFHDHGKRIIVWFFLSSLFVHWNLQSIYIYPDVALITKKIDFFDNVTLLLTLIDEDKFMNILCNIILLVNLLRVIQCTSGRNSEKSAHYQFYYVKYL